MLSPGLCNKCLIHLFLSFWIVTCGVFGCCFYGRLTFEIFWCSGFILHICWWKPGACDWRCLWHSSSSLSYILPRCAKLSVAFIFSPTQVFSLLLRDIGSVFFTLLRALWTLITRVVSGKGAWRHLQNHALEIFGEGQLDRVWLIVVVKNIFGNSMQPCLKQACCVTSYNQWFES